MYAVDNNHHVSHAISNVLEPLKFTGEPVGMGSMSDFTELRSSGGLAESAMALSIPMFGVSTLNALATVAPRMLA